MLKILYASNQSKNSKLQLQRFLDNAKGLFDIKIAAYKNFFPLNYKVDWTLDYLISSSNPNAMSYTTQAAEFYYHQIKTFNPDFIISDCNIPTSHMGSLLKIPVWQCGSSLMRFALENFASLHTNFNIENINFDDTKKHNERIINLINQSDKIFIYSHFGDTLNPPQLKSNYSYIRPYFQTHSYKNTCHHAITAAMIGNNKKILKLLKEYEDTVVFTENYTYEEYSNIKIKNLSEQQEEYYCNLRSSDLYLCEGQTNLLADAFYNKKYCFSYALNLDIDSLLNNSISQKLGLSTTIYEDDQELFLKYIDKTIKYDLKPNITFLHETILNNFN